MGTQVAPSVNYWPETACARAFWGQQELPPYRQLLRHTARWLDPTPDEHWLDLGCGCGQLTRALWRKSEGQLAGIVAMDCAAANAVPIERLSVTLRPAPDGRVRFVHADFLTGLAGYKNDAFDGVVSGLAVQYAQSYSDEQDTWTTEAYDRTLAEVYRVLRPGGRFVFSVNVPRPSFGWVAFTSVPGFFISRNPPWYLLNAFRMWGYGRWLHREADKGRFQYLPLETVLAKLHTLGFVSIKHRLSFARQAYLIRCAKP
jgi:SAM-dependent methyltransferase